MIQGFETTINPQSAGISDGNSPQSEAPTKDMVLGNIQADLAIDKSLSVGKSLNRLLYGVGYQILVQPSIRFWRRSKRHPSAISARFAIWCRRNLPWHTTNGSERNVLHKQCSAYYSSHEVSFIQKEQVQQISPAVIPPWNTTRNIREKI